MPDAMGHPLVPNLAIMSLELRASILAAQEDTVKSRELFAEAAKKEKDLGYHEPPAYIRPVGETEGLVMLGAGDAEAAHAAYAAALVERPNSGLSLYGLARSSEAAGKPMWRARSMRSFWRRGRAAIPGQRSVHMRRNF